MKCTYLPQGAEQDYVWRRIQVSQQQAEKQKKSILQMAMIFHSRTEKILQDLLGVSVLNIRMFENISKPK